MPVPDMPTAEQLGLHSEDGRDALQNLYHWCDWSGDGNVGLAWYAQCRAEGKSHQESILDTIDHFHLHWNDWFQLRIKRHEERVAESARLEMKMRDRNKDKKS